MPFATFRDALRRPDILSHLRDGLIGDDILIPSPFGTQRLLYADYTASGRALRQVEDFVTEQVLPYYANSHTEASFCGAAMTRMREAARAVIADLVGCGPDSSVIFTGSGATSGINRLVGLLDIAGQVGRGGRVVVLIGPYEHHSNILPWRESGAEVVEVEEAPEGGPDANALQRALNEARDADLVIAAFSAASNVTGILTDTDAVTRQVKASGALAIWDYAAGAPYLPVDMGQGAAAKDAIVFSPHKFAGGPGASGLLVVRDTLPRKTQPTAPGGGSVRFVSPWGHQYSDSLAAREEAGTPNVIGDIRAALALMVKEAVGTDVIADRDRALRARALQAWADMPELELLGNSAANNALPIFSFRVRAPGGGYIPHQLFTRMLSDVYGIQARGGCACAGPYAHRLLGLGQQMSQQIVLRLEDGHELDRPGWVRLNLSYLHSDAQVDRILDGVASLARQAPDLQAHYAGEDATARFRPLEAAE